MFEPWWPMYKIRFNQKKTLKFRIYTENTKLEQNRRHSNMEFSRTIFWEDVQIIKSHWPSFTLSSDRHPEPSKQQKREFEYNNNRRYTSDRLLCW